MKGMLPLLEHPFAWRPGAVKHARWDRRNSRALVDVNKTTPNRDGNGIDPVVYF